MYRKIEQNLIFNKKRNPKITTPCCGKSNKDVKFVTYKNYPEIYGYCHSCGKTTLPPTIYEDDFGNQYYWNTVNNTFENVLQLYDKIVLQNITNIQKQNINRNKKQSKKIKFIDFKEVTLSIQSNNKNNLLNYIQSIYGSDKTNFVKHLYYIGTSSDSGTIFWNINKKQKVQKSKICYYQENGKRTSKFKVPYKNENSYYSCLFGEHLLKKNNKPIILVESEKTAIICSINFTDFTWLSYGGINGMTNEKMKVLEGKDILIVPDLSDNARSITIKKIEELKQFNINAKMWDLSKGMTDEELNEKGYYNLDLEDFLRDINFFKSKK